MREIKFRAWDKLSKSMYYQEYKWFFNAEYNDISFTLHFDKGQTADIWDIEDENLILMQYTGFKDKNDKEIYEGDIYKQGDYIGKIFWSVDFWATENGNYDDSGLADDCNHIEIIGNIYENSELLENNIKAI